MIQRDFILRLIEQLGEALRSLRLLNAGEGSESTPTTREVSEILENACQQGLGLDFSTILQKGPDELIDLFLAGGDTWISRSFFAARLLEIHAAFLSSSGNSSHAYAVGSRSLYIYTRLRNNERVPAQYELEDRITHVTTLLREWKHL